MVNAIQMNLKSVYIIKLTFSLNNPRDFDDSRKILTIFTCINYVQYKRGCADQVRHVISTNEDVQYKQGMSSVQMRMFSTSKATNENVQ